MSEDNRNTEDMPSRTKEEIDAESDEYKQFQTFGTSSAGEEMNGQKAGQPNYKDVGAFDPPDVPGVDSYNLPGTCRDPLRGDSSAPKEPAELDDDPAKPNTPEDTSQLPPQSPPPTHTESTNQSIEGEGQEEQQNTQSENNENNDSSEETNKTITVNNEDNSNQESDDPIFCPHCGQELTKQVINDSVFYCHTADQGCDETFSSIEEIEEIIAQKEARKKVLEEARAAEAKKKEEMAKANTPPQQTTPSTSQAIPSEIYLIFSNQLSGIVKTLAEIQAKDAKLDALSNDLADLKKQLEELKQEKETINLPEITSKLSETAENLNKTQSGLSQNLESTVELNEAIGKLKEGGRELLMITDNAGQQFVQYMNGVKQMDKYANRIKFVLPKVEEYLKTLEECYENLTKRYAKDQKDFGEHFRKQTQSFFKEASKKMVFSQATGGTPGMTAMIIPSIIAFILMFLLHILTK